MARQTLRFPIELWTRTHDDGSLTVSVLGEPDLALWGPERPPLVEELLLALSDRLERTHPRLLERLAAASPSEIREVEVPDALILAGSRTAEDEPVHAPATLTVVITARGGSRELWLPRLDARQWLAPGADVDQAAVALARELIAKWTAVERLALRQAGPETLEVHELAVTVAPLGRFTGPEGPRDLLPEPAPPEEVRPDGKRVAPTPTLHELGQPLHELARRGRLGRAWEREDDLRRLLDLLAGKSAPLVLVGPRGIGKSVLLDELARRLAADDAPPTLRGRPAWYVDADRLIAGASGFGGWQEQLLDVIRELVVAEATWFLGPLLPLVDAGRSAHSDQNVAQMLGPALTTGELRVIGECSDADWAQLQLRNPGFAGLFVPVRLAEPPPDGTRRIVDRVADELPVPIDAGGRAAVLELAARYGRRDSRLGASVALLRRVAASASADGAGARIDRLRVVRHVCEETGIPEVLVRDDLALDRDALAARFGGRIRGQGAVVAQMADLVVRIKAGLADDSRPLGAYLFLGPTGVGKTETVKALAEWLYGDADRILRFDMSEYAGADCVDRLLGADEGSGLVARVEQTPFAVVLLDEVEKAHPAVFDLLLQVLGEARLSDRTGRTADFRNSIVLMTSNLGVGTYRRPSGFGADERVALRDHLLAEVRRFFRPELVGRLDAVVAFEPLGAEPIGHITHRELERVQRRDGFVGRDIGLVLAPAVSGWLAARGVDLRYGARPLKRAIERELVAPIARALSAREHAPRAVEVAVDGDALTVHLSSEATASAPRDAELRAALDAVSQLRYTLRRWGEVRALRSAEHAVRLVHRLADTRAFWRDEAAARQRLAAVEEPARVVEAHVKLREQVDALEDLVLEAWAAPSAARDSVDALLAEVRAAEEALYDLEWTIAGLDRSERDAITLWFCPGGRDEVHDHKSMEPLILAYVRVAVRRGWRLRVAVRPVVDWSEREEPETPIAPSEVATERAHWRESAEVTEESDALGFLRGRANQEVVELRILGKHAATMLEGEAGLHGLETAERPLADVAILVWSSSADPSRERIRLLRPPRPGPRQRLIAIPRDRLRDYVLGRQTGIGRLPDQLEILLRERMLARMFSEREDRW